MTREQAELPFLSTIGLMLTYKCTIACPHCLVEAGPHRSEEVFLRHALAWIRQASVYRNGYIKALALTGGEPFYNLSKLARVSSFGERYGFLVSVVTNAFWASTKLNALETLKQVPAIQLLSISTDTYHQKSIPFDYIENALWAAKRMDRTYNIAVCTHSEEDPGYLRIREDIERIGEADNVQLSITIPVGRGEKAARHFDYKTAPEPTVAACSMAGSPIVFPDGRVIACIGPVLTLPGAHPMLLGNVLHESLAEILDRAEDNPILHAVRVWGPHKLVSLLEERGFDDLLPQEYLSDCTCDTCYRLFSDARIVAALDNVFGDEDLRRTVAYARAYYLDETGMVERYERKPGGPAGPGQRATRSAGALP